MTNSEHANSIFGGDITKSDRMIRPDKFDAEKILYEVKEILEKPKGN